MSELDITERLRDPKYDCAAEAADEIEKLLAERDRLRAALLDIEDTSDDIGSRERARAGIENSQ